MSTKKHFTARQIEERQRIEAELAAIPKLSPAIQRLTSTDGFANYFLSMRHLYPTQIEAYNRLEDFHIDVTGKRRYSDFFSFYKVLNDQLRKYRL